MMILSHSRWTLRALAAAVLLLGEFACSSPSAAQTTSTWTAGGTMDNWIDPENWDNEPAINAYPDNNGGGNFLVEIPRGRVTLDDDITVTSLDLGVDTNEGGFVTGGKQLVSEIGTLIGTQGGFDGGGGMFTSQGGIDVAGAFLIDSWAVNSQGILAVGVAGGNGSVRLEGDAQLVLQQGLEFLKDGSISSPVGGNDLVTNQGEFKRAATATGSSDVNVNFISSGGTIGTTFGTLSFAHARTAGLTNSTLNIDANGTLQFSGNTTLTGTTTVAGNGEGTVRFGGSTANVTLNGTIAAMAGASEAPSVVFAGNEFSGGTLNLGPAGSFFHSSGSLGVSSLVTNTGRYQWQGGEITGMGLQNENNIAGQTLINGVTQKTIEDGALTNMGHITQQSNIRLDADGKVLNSIGATYRLEDAIVNSGPSANLETGFFNQGTLESSGNSQFSVRLNSSKEILVKSGSLKLGGPTNLTGTTEFPAVVQLSDGANLQIGVNSSSVSNLTNVRFEPSAGVGPPDETKINFVGGASSLSGEISSQGIGEIVHESGTVRIRSTDSATLEFADSAPFVIDSDPNLSRIQVSGALTNDGAIRWDKGTISGAGQFVNAEANGLITVTGLANLGAPGIPTILNNDGVINVTAQIDQGFVLPAGSRLVNRKEGLLDFIGNGGVLRAGETNVGSFENSGIVAKIDGTFSGIYVPFVQTADGTLEVQSGNLRFLDTATLRGTAENRTTVEVLRGEGKSSAGVNFNENSVSENVHFSFDSGSATYSNRLSIFRGTISGGGSNGGISLFAQESRIDGDVVFDVNGSSVSVVQRGGVIQGTGRVTNKGNFELLAGGIANQGTEPQSGSLTAKAFTNEGLFQWRGGTIQTSFENAKGTLGITVLEGENDKLLVNSTLMNSADLRHRVGDLRVDQNSKIVNQPGGEYSMNQLARIVPPMVGQPGHFDNRGTLVAVATSEEGPAVIGIPFINQGGVISATESTAQLNITAGYTFIGGAIDLPMSAILNVGAAGTIAGTTFELDDQATATFASPTVSGALTGSGLGKVEFQGAKVAGNSGTTLRMSRLDLTGNTNLFGQTTNLDLLTIEPGTSNTLRFVETDANSNPVARGGLLVNERGGGLNFEQVSISHELAEPLAQSLWGEVQNKGDMGLTGPAQGGKFLMNETRLRNFAGGRVQSFVGLIQGNGTIVNQGRFEAHATVIETTFDNTGTFVAETGANEIRNLTQIAEGVLTGGTYQVRPGATLSVGSGGFQINLADIRIDGATAEFEQAQQVHTNFGSGVFQGGYSYENTAESFTNVGVMSFDNALGSFNSLDIADGNLTLQNNSLLTADDVSVQPGASLRADDSTITANQVNNGGTLNIGSSPGYALIEGNYTQTGTLEMEIGGLVPGVDYDLLEIAGTSQLGGLLDVTGLDLGNYSPAVGDSFPLLTSTSSIQGTFDLVNYPATIGGWYVTWYPVDYSDPSQVALEIASVDYLQADFDRDGDVDRDDLAKWQAGYGMSASATQMDGDADGDGDVDGADFLIWQRQGGLGVSSLSTTAAAVPEPTTALLLCAGMTIALRSMRTGGLPCLRSIRGRNHE